MLRRRFRFFGWEAGLRRWNGQAFHECSDPHDDEIPNPQFGGGFALSLLVATIRVCVCGEGGVLSLPIVVCCSSIDTCTVL